MIHWARGEAFLRRLKRALVLWARGEGCVRHLQRVLVGEFPSQLSSGVHSIPSSLKAGTSNCIPHITSREAPSHGFLLKRSSEGEDVRWWLPLHHLLSQVRVPWQLTHFLALPTSPPPSPVPAPSPCPAPSPPRSLRLFLSFRVSLCLPASVSTCVVWRSIAGTCSCPTSTRSSSSATRKGAQSSPLCSLLVRVACILWHDTWIASMFRQLVMCKFKVACFYTLLYLCHRQESKEIALVLFAGKRYMLVDG